MRLGRLACGILVGTAVLACASRSQTGIPLASCPVSESALPFEAAPMGRLAGTYRLTMVADSFPRPGATSSGLLHLRVQTDTLRRYYVFNVIAQEWRRVGERPLVGTLDMDRRPIAAPATGDPMSMDPDAPGVYFEAWDGAFYIGRLRNTPDGMSTQLVPRRASERGFRGRWEPDYGLAWPVDSVTGDYIKVGGRFCAERLDPDVAKRTNQPGKGR